MHVELILDDDKTTPSTLQEIINLLKAEDDELEISGRMSFDCALLLSDFFKISKTVTSVTLKSLHIEPDGFALICEGLRQNVMITKIEIRDIYQKNTGKEFNWLDLKLEMVTSP